MPNDQSEFTATDINGQVVKFELLNIHELKCSEGLRNPETLFKTIHDVLTLTKGSYLGGRTITNLRRLVKEGTITRKTLVVYCGGYSLDNGSAWDAENKMLPEHCPHCGRPY